MKLDVEDPYIDLPKIKNERPRRVPLSEGAVSALKSLVPESSRESCSRPDGFVDRDGEGIIHAFRDAVTERELPDLRDHEIMAISGHLTPAMLARYTHLRADRLGARLPGGPLNRR